MTHMTTNKKAAFDADATALKIARYRLLYRLSLVFNLVLFGLSFYQFASVGYRFVCDTFFVVVNLLNVLGFYLTYKAFDLLSFQEHRLKYFTQNPEN